VHFLKEHLSKRGLHFITYLQLANALNRKSRAFPALRDMSPRVALFFDEFHALVDAPAAGDSQVTEKILAPVRKRIFQEPVACCLAFTWTFMTQSASNAVALMVMLRGKPWADAHGLDKQGFGSDWPALLPTNFQGNRFFAVDAARQARVAEIHRQVTRLECPVKVNDLPNLALTVADYNLMYALFRNHVYYFDVSGDVRRVLVTSARESAAGEVGYDAAHEPPLSAAPAAGDQERRDWFKAKDTRYVTSLLSTHGYSGALPPGGGERGAKFREWYEGLEASPGGKGELAALHNELGDFVDPLQRHRFADKSSRHAEGLARLLAKIERKFGRIPASSASAPLGAPSVGRRKVADVTATAHEVSPGARATRTKVVVSVSADGFEGDEGEQEGGAPQSHSHRAPSDPYWTSAAFREEDPLDFARRVLRLYHYHGRLPLRGAGSGPTKAREEFVRWCEKATSKASGNADAWLHGMYEDLELDEKAARSRSRKRPKCRDIVDLVGRVAAGELTRPRGSVRADSATRPTAPPKRSKRKLTLPGGDARADADTEVWASSHPTTSLRIPSSSHSTASLGTSSQSSSSPPTLPAPPPRPAQKRGPSRGTSTGGVSACGTSADCEERVDALTWLDIPPGEAVCAGGALRFCYDQDSLAQHCGSPYGRPTKADVEDPVNAAALQAALGLTASGRASSGLSPTAENAAAHLCKDPFTRLLFIRRSSGAPLATVSAGSSLAAPSFSAAAPPRPVAVSASATPRQARHAYYGWRGPEAYASVLPTTSQIEAWRSAHNGDFARLITFPTIEAPVEGSAELESLRKKLGRKPKKGASKDPGKFSLFPSWDSVTGTRAPTPQNACDLGTDVDLESFLDGAYKRRSEADKRLLTDLLRCRAPKLHKFLEIAAEEMRIPETGAVASRNAAVYLPVRFSKKIVYNLFARSVAVALDLQVDDPEKRPARVEPGKGFVFILSDKSHPRDGDTYNTATLQAFFSLSNDKTRNVLVLTLKHDQSTDAKGGNCIFRFQPFSLGRTKQIVGREHRRGAQNNYPAPSVLENYELLFPPDPEGEETRLSCDGLLRSLYSLAGNAEAQLIDMVMTATFACSAMSWLHAKGLDFMPGSYCLSPEESAEGLKVPEDSEEVGVPRHVSPIFPSDPHYRPELYAEPA
jgi:hypothetical protein